MTEGIEYISPPVSGAGASGDHGDLTGLADDDHSQYETSAEAAAKVTAHEAAGDPHPGYMTSAETAAAYQPLDSDLTAVAAISPSNDDVIQRKGGVWVARSMAQVKTDLTLAHSDLSGLTTGDPHTQYVTKALVDAKGDLVAGSANDTVARVAVGANGSLLMADDSAAAGVSYGRPANPSPTDHGLLSWSSDPAFTTSSTILGVAGTIYTVKLAVAYAATVTNVLIYLSTAGGTLTSGQCFAALYDASKNLLSATADQATGWQSNGLRTMALSVAQPVTAGYYYVAFFANGTTLPTPLRAGSSTNVNLNLSTATSRWATADTGRTTSMPSTLGAFTATSNAYWAALS